MVGAWLRPFRRSYHITCGLSRDSLSSYFLSWCHLMPMGRSTNTNQPLYGTIIMRTSDRPNMLTKHKNVLCSRAARRYVTCITMCLATLLSRWLSNQCQRSEVVNSSSRRLSGPNAGAVDRCKYNPKTCSLQPQLVRSKWRARHYYCEIYINGWYTNTRQDLWYARSLTRSNEVLSDMERLMNISSNVCKLLLNDEDRVRLSDIFGVLFHLFLQNSTIRNIRRV